jgi:hypothetical protein
MFIEHWKHTAFGSDFGSDVLRFLESFPGQKISLEDIYSRCDLRTYFAEPELLLRRADNNVTFTVPSMGDMPITVHYEDMVIAICAVAAECAVAGTADLANAFGTKSVVLNTTDDELQTLERALTEIHQWPERFILFVMCGHEERQETLADVRSILEQLRSAITH